MGGPGGSYETRMEEEAAARAAVRLCKGVALNLSLGTFERAGSLPQETRMEKEAAAARAAAKAAQGGGRRPPPRRKRGRKRKDQGSQDEADGAWLLSLLTGRRDMCATQRAAV